MPAVKTVKKGDTRFYVSPDDRDVRVPGVTSILNMIPKPFLTFWAAKVAAETAVECLPEVVGLALKDRQGAVDFIKSAHRRSTAGSADIGTEVHNLAERIARGESVGRVHPDYAPFVQHINEFHDKFQPEYLHLEVATWSDTHRYAGSLDWIARIEGEVVIGDWKTTRSGVHSEVALQLAAYANADYILHDDGRKEDLPKIDAGAVTHLRPEGWKLVPVRVDEEVFNAFLTARAMFEVVNGTLKNTLGDPVYDSQAATSTGSQRRASKR